LRMRGSKGFATKHRNGGGGGARGSHGGGLDLVVPDKM
jgi:hypothetical protein